MTFEHYESTACRQCGEPMRSLLAVCVRCACRIVRKLQDEQRGISLKGRE